MSFFTMSDGQQAQGGSYEVAGSEPIPSGTQLRAIIDEIKWDEYEGEQYISARWSVIDGEYKNRKVFQKIKVAETDANKRDKALRMLAAIDTNAGGRIQASGQSPTDMDLQQNLMNKMMIIKVQTWEMNDRKGNWVSAVAPAVQGQQATASIDSDVPF